MTGSLSSSDLEGERQVAATQEVAKDGTVITAYGSILKDSKVDVLSEDKELGGLSASSHVFQDPEVAEYYRQLYAKSGYECRHRYDPEFEWEPEEERKLVWKLEYKVCLWACIMFMGLQIDRGNLQQALADNMLKDTGMTTNQYNYGQTIFHATFLCSELPSQLVSKKLGPDRWIPIQMTIWSIISILQCKITGPHSFYATRALLGIIEGGFIPDMVLWMSYFYTGKELPVRLSFFWTALSVTGILTSLLAFGLLRMRGILGWAGW